MHTPRQLRSLSRVMLLLTLGMAVLSSSGCSREIEEHVHEPGTHGGFIIAIGQDHNHAEVVFSDGQMSLYILDKDQTKVATIAEQEIEIFLRPFGDAKSQKLTLKPTPLKGDPAGQTSLFRGDLPKDLKPTLLLVTVPMIEMNGNRFRFSFSTSEPIMPAKINDEAERELYLMPGGAYTAEDIAANGNQTASQKFAQFQSQHDPNPKPGAKICPITGTVANADCSWIIGGQTYTFCCPPCVDEFVRKAKTDPKSIAPADSYVKK